MIIDEDVFLEHFGIRGMKWGVRKQRPVSEKRQAKREANAQKFDARAAMLQTRITELSSKKSRTPFGRKKTRNEISELDAQRKTALTDAELKRQGKLSTKQKKVVKGAAITAGILAAYGTYNMAQSGELNRKAVQGKNFLLGKKTVDFTKNVELANKNLGVDGIMKHVVKDINPDYGEFGTKMNCRRCTFAYEMRRRGYDVSATRTTNGRGQSPVGVYNALYSDKEGIARTGTLSTLFRIGKEKSETGDASPYLKTVMRGWGENAIGDNEGIAGVKAEHIFKTLAGQPSGSRGEIGMGWFSGGGHSVAYEIVKGKPVIFDTQTGKKFLKAADFEKEYGPNVLRAAFTRLDNQHFSEDFLMRWMRNAKH